MNKALLDFAVEDFLRSNAADLEYVYKVKNKPGAYVRLTMVHVEGETKAITESFESRSYTISSLPAGEVCNACNGTGLA